MMEGNRCLINGRESPNGEQGGESNIAGEGNMTEKEETPLNDE